MPPEQHLLDGVRVVRQEGVAVVVPPLHHRVVTAKVGVPDEPTKLRAAQGALAETLRDLERRYEPTPAGLAVTVAWGLPYFRRFVPGPSAKHLPMDARASAAAGKPVRALLDAIRFPSDPVATILEENDVAFLLRSDTLEHIDAAAKSNNWIPPPRCLARSSTGAVRKPRWSCAPATRYSSTRTA